MKKSVFAITITLLSVSMTLYALPCANGKGILYKGDSTEEVIKQCGAPDLKKTIYRIISTAQNWIYYRPHLYDTGVSQIIVLFKNNRVTNILINDRYWLPTCRKAYLQIGQVSTIQTSCGNWIYQTSLTNLCGRTWGVGDTTQTVAAFCGEPAGRSDLQKEMVEETTFTYQGSNPQTIIFNNGKIVDFQ